jgi:hypothetical protein
MDVDDRKRPATVLVWVKLRVGDDLVGVDAVELSQDAKITHLRNAVKLRFSPKLDYFAAAELQVYPAGTLVPVGDGMDPGDVIPTGTTSKSALIVVAPAPVQQDNGEC